MAYICIHCRSEIDPSYKACPFCGEPVTDFLRRYAGVPIDGKYQILGRLGVGGMGEVYKVLHVHLNAVRVIKLIRASLADSAVASERFLREARLATRITNPNVATLFDFAILPDGTLYTVWEYIEAITLSELIADHGALSPRYAAELVAQALQGLDAIHRAGIVHRDISPENLMIMRDDEGKEHVKIIDLGIAKGSEPDDVNTKTGMFVGKWRYCSPEHLGMLPEGERMDGRADLYSMGIVLYEALTGAPPFQADTPHGYLKMHASERPKPLRHVLPSAAENLELEALVFRALEKDREKRFSSARDFAASLEALVPFLSDVRPVTPRLAVRHSIEGNTVRETPPRKEAERVEAAVAAEALHVDQTPASPSVRGAAAVSPACQGPDLTLPRSVGRFTLLEEIAPGKTGRLFKAWDPMRRRLIGLKLVSAATQADEARMHKSAGVWLDLVHENIVRIYEVREAGADHGPLIVMDLVNGVALDRFVAETPLTLEQKLQVVVQICHALKHVHAQGILHREVKPANILIVRESLKAMLLDSGIARPEAADVAALTHAGSVVGDINYMAPEQLAGEPEQRSDVFSLGAVLYFLLTRSAPTALDVAKMIVRLEQCSDVPRRVRDVVAKALEPDLERRYESAAALEAAIEDLL